MRRHIEILRIINKHDTPAFQEPIEWYSNGRRGHLHTVKTCGTHDLGSIVTQHISLKDALTVKKVCEGCDHKMQKTPEQQRVYEIVESFAKISTHLNWLMVHPSNTIGGLPLLVQWRNEQVCKTLSAELTGIDATNSGLDTWKKQIENDLRNRQPKSVSRSKLNKEVLRWSAISVLRKQLAKGSTEPAMWGGTEVIDLFGLPEYGDFGERNYPLVPLAKLLKRWTELLETGKTPVEATQMISDDTVTFKEIIGDASERAMQYSVTSEPPKPGEMVWDYTQRLWYKHANRALQYTLATWTEMLAALQADAQPTMFGVIRVDADIVDTLANQESVNQILAGSLNWTVDNAGLGAIICHPTIGKFLDISDALRQQLETRRSVQLDDIPTQEIVRNTLTLWDPSDDTSSYHIFANAFGAAKLL